MVLGHELPHSVGSLGEHLVNVPVGQTHDSQDLGDESRGDTRLEEITHRIDEDGSRSPPGEGLEELLGHEADVESLLVGVAGNPAPSLCERLRVAVLAAGTHLRAAPDGVPRCVSPFDLASVTHCSRKRGTPNKPLTRTLPSPRPCCKGQGPMRGSAGGKPRCNPGRRAVPERRVPRDGTPDFELVGRATFDLPPVLLGAERPAACSLGLHGTRFDQHYAQQAGPPIGPGPPGCLAP